MIGLPALLQLAEWCRKRREMDQGGVPCDRLQRVSPPRRNAKESIPLKELWQVLLPGTRQKVLQTLGRIVTQQLKPPLSKEAKHE